MKSLSSLSSRAASRLSAAAATVALAGALLGGATRAARADSIGINFNGNNAGSTLAAGTNAGVVVQKNWNNLNNSSGTSGALNNNLGTATTTTLTYAAADFTSLSSPVAVGDEQLNNGIIFSDQNTAVNFTLNNISYGSYDIYVYNLALDGTNQVTTLGGTSYYGTSPDPGGPGYLDGDAATPFTYTRATSTTAGTYTPNVDYVRFTGLSGTSQSFSVTGLNNVGIVGGIQLVNTSPVPEPSTWAMMAFGVGALCLVVRKRREGDLA